MSESYAKPNREQIKKLLSFISDPVGYHLMACSIEAMKRLDPEYDPQETQYREWEFLTRRLLWKFGLFQIVEHVYRLYEVSADEYWESFVPPTESTEEDKIMISKEWKSG